MRSAIKELINSMVSTIGTIIASSPDGANVEFTAYTSVPTNAGGRYILVRHNSSEEIPVKDRYLEQGTIDVIITDQTKEDSASDTLLYNAKKVVEDALSPSLYYSAFTLTNGETIDFRKTSESYSETALDGLGKVKQITIQVFYMLEWTGAAS
jgi:hypothetical protein